VGSSFINSSVHNQLAAQQIYFPPAAAFQHAKAGTEITPSMIPSVSQYAGQLMTTGAQAEVYADHFIAVHLSEMPYGGVYAKASAAALANPNNAAIQGEVATIFKGTTLRDSSSTPTPSDRWAPSPASLRSAPSPSQGSCCSCPSSGSSTSGGPQRPSRSAPTFTAGRSQPGHSPWVGPSEKRPDPNDRGASSSRFHRLRRPRTVYFACSTTKEFHVDYQ